MNINIFVNKTDFEKPDSFGYVDVSVVEKCRDFVLIVDNPFVRLDFWLNTSALCTHNITIVAPKYEPCTNDISAVAKFCMQYHVKLLESELEKDYTNKFIKMYGCTFVNISKVLTQPKLILVGIPSNVKYVDIPDNELIVGISTNTINLNNLSFLRVPGELYGNFKKEFTKSCSINHNCIVYKNKFANKSVSGAFENKREWEYI